MKRHGTRGGDSIQHEWLVRQLATRIPKATIDARIGTKAVDVVISYNATHHERLATFLGITPGDGDLIGIEVEVSRAEKTAKSNAEKNAAVGITYSVIATLLPLRHKPKGAIVVDVFELLEAL